MYVVVFFLMLETRYDDLTSEANRSCGRRQRNDLKNEPH